MLASSKRVSAIWMDPECEVSGGRPRIGYSILSWYILPLGKCIVVTFSCCIVGLEKGQGLFSRIG